MKQCLNLFEGAKELDYTIEYPNRKVQNKMSKLKGPRDEKSKGQRVQTFKKSKEQKA